MFASCVWTQASCLPRLEHNMRIIFGNVKKAPQIKHWPDEQSYGECSWVQKERSETRMPRPASYSNTPTRTFPVVIFFSQLSLWPTFWQIPLKPLTVFKHNITAMQMTCDSLPRTIGVHYLRAVCHRIHRLLFLAILYAAEKTRYWTLNTGKVECSSHQ